MASCPRYHRRLSHNSQIFTLSNAERAFDTNYVSENRPKGPRGRTGMGTMAGQDLVTYDVVVVGGGAAGLSGALMLGRSRRSVLVIDAGEPRNAPAAGVHGFLTRDGTDPAVLLQVGREEVSGYGARVLDGRVASAESVDGGFTVTLQDGRRVGARRLLVTTGLVDELPDVPGVRERWRSEEHTSE